MIRLKPLSEQVVVVMGASSGIGRETARQLGERGARVVVAARDREALETLVAEIAGGGGQARAVPADVSVMDEVQDVADQAVAAFGGLDTWVHASAVALYARFEDTSPEEFRRVLDVDLMGPVHGAKAALPHLRRRGQGAFVCVSSVEARRSFPYHAAYAAAKHGIDGFLEALRVELHQEGVPISVTNVLPGSVNTPLFDKARTKLGVKPMPMPPIYEPRTVAPVILHAAEHPARDLIAGGAAKGLLLTQRLSPRMLDAFFVRFGFRTQRTDEVKDAAAGDNLFQAMPGMGRVEGSFGNGSWSRSAYNSLELRSPLRRVGQALTGPPRHRDSSEPKEAAEGGTAP
jgi:NAD(P)-dependent dehydrogenase (short-subunit alcohol dehydrogenase family)